jgi:transcriptional regulator
MYLRPAFAETDTARITALIRANPFGLLITTGANGMEASHIPFTLLADGEGFLLAGHLAAGNAQCAALAGGQALAVFSGPHAYISPGWYRTQPAVPTWDYCAVHVSGKLRLTEDEGDILASLRALAVGDPAGFDLDALAPDYRRKMIAGIRAFTLKPDKIEAQWKMSQNRSPEDRLGVVAALRASGDATADAVAALITQTLPET